jgi:hypothetical protein
MTDNPATPATQQLGEIAREARSSIELSRDAKGVYRWDIKLYFDAGLIDAYNEPDGEAPRAMRLLRSIDERLRAQFVPSGDTE